MTQALIYSIAPEYIKEIANGNKTIEVRKRDLPQWAKDKLAKGEDVWGYGYCTKGKPYLYRGKYEFRLHDGDYGAPYLNGRVVVKFKVSGVSKIDNEPYHDDWLKFGKQACLDEEQWYQYFTWSKDGGGYAHHITDITPVEMELGEFKTVDVSQYQDAEGNPSFDDYFELTKAPQSFQTVWVKGE